MVVTINDKVLEGLLVILLYVSRNVTNNVLNCFTQLESGRIGSVEGSQFLITLVCELGLHKLEI